MILDTNVLSEMMKPAEDRSPAVVDWLRRQPLRSLHTTAMTVGELMTGIDIPPAGRRRDDLARAADAILAEVFEGRILPFDEAAGRALGTVVTIARRTGRAVSIVDAQIAAIALVHGFSVATRDTRGFEPSGVATIDPWNDL